MRERPEGSEEPQGGAPENLVVVALGGNAISPPGTASPIPAQADGQFAPGSMLPKVQAVLRFLEDGGRRAIITTPELSEKALAGEIGTQVTR